MAKGAVPCPYNCGKSFNTAASMAIHMARCRNGPKKKGAKYTKRPKDDE